MGLSTFVLCALLRDLIRMGTVLAIFKIMPESVEVNLEIIEEEARSVVEKYGAEVNEMVQEPVAFGVRCIKLSIGIDESRGNLDPLEDQLRNLEGVLSVEIIDVRRAIG